MAVKPGSMVVRPGHRHKQSRCEATRQHHPILTGVDGDDTTTQHISRCEAWSQTQAKQV